MPGSTVTLMLWILRPAFGARGNRSVRARMVADHGAFAEHGARGEAGVAPDAHALAEERAFDAAVRREGAALPHDGVAHPGPGGHGDVARQHRVRSHVRPRLHAAPRPDEEAAFELGSSVDVCGGVGPASVARLALQPHG